MCPPLQPQVALLVVVLTITIWPLRQCLATDLHDQLRIISESYQANRAAFTHGKCLFQYSVVSASNEEAALRSEWNDVIPPLSVDCVWYFRDDEQVLKMAVDNDDIVRRLKQNSGIITPVNVAVKGGYAIDSDAIVTDAIVHSPSNNNLNIRYHPFNLAIDSGKIDLASIIAPSLAGRANDVPFEVDTGSMLNGKPYVLLKTVGDGKTVSTDFVWYLDSSRGYLPYVTEFSIHPAGEFVARMFLLSAEQVGDAHFPTHAMYIAPLRPDDREPYVRVREMKVLELDLNYVPTDDDLTILLPKHTQFSDGIDPKTAKTLFRDQRDNFAKISVKDLKPIHDQLQALAIQRRSEEVAIGLQRSGPGGAGKRSASQFLPLIAINLVVGTVLIGWLVVRRRKASTPTE